VVDGLKALDPKRPIREADINSAVGQNRVSEVENLTEISTPGNVVTRRNEAPKVPHIVRVAVFAWR
jgi:hypothetical protein